MKFLTSKEARNAYNSGYILQNRNSSNYVIVFQFCYMHFSSTQKRANKGKHYRLDDKFWRIESKSTFDKFKYIFDKNIKRIKNVSM